MQAILCRPRASYSPSMVPHMHLHKPYFWHRFGFHFFAQEVLTPECVAAGCSNRATHPPYCEQHNSDGIFGIRITSCMDRPGQWSPQGSFLLDTCCLILVRYCLTQRSWCATALASPHTAHLQLIRASGQMLQCTGALPVWWTMPRARRATWSGTCTAATARA
jgi:hypothetical protein